MRKPKPRSPAPAPLDTIYAKREPRRPHYLAKLMDRKPVSRGQLIEDLGVDKSQLSRWLDKDKPQTPNPHWAKQLGRYFAASDDPDDFVDIFTDPDLQRFQRITRHMPPDEVDRMLALFEAGYRAKRA